VPIGIGSNIAGLKAQRRLSEGTSALTKSYEQLSSGQRINQASDDAAGLAIATALNSRAKVYGQAVRNANDGLSLYAIADSAVSSLTDINTRLQELASQAANGVYSTTQRQAMDAEAQALSKEYFRISRAAQFNGQRLFDGSMSNGLTLQLGYGRDGSISSSVGGKLGTGTVALARSFTSDSWSTNDVALGDLNGDGVLDMVTVGVDSYYQNTLSIRIGDGTGRFSTSASLTTEIFGSSIALGDLNGDGALDIAVGGSSSGGRAMVLLNNGAASFNVSASYTTESSYSASITLGDISGDGVLDLVTAGSASGAGRATVRLGAGDGTFRTALSYAAESVASRAVKLADLNNDGRLDLITAGNGGGGAFTVRLGTGAGIFGSATSFSADASGSSSLAMGDINADGNLDIVTGGTAGSQISSATVRLGDGRGGFSGATTYTASSLMDFFYSLHDIELSDLTGDGNLDLITATSISSFGESQILIRQGSASGTFGATTSTNLTSGATVQAPKTTIGDVNGDGVTDIVHAQVTYDGDYLGTTSVFFGNTRDGISPLQPFSLQSRGDALQALGLFARTAKNLSDIQASLGATQSRVNVAVNGLLTARENFIAAESRIRDVDIAQESARLVSTQIRQQAAAAVLAQANLAPQLGLRLLS
jgi:flagellin-like hook-associated protein FlgL